jgi:hypothetical protein
MRSRLRGTVPTIMLAADGFVIHSKEDVHVCWGDITKISAYKLDLGTFDEICLGIYTSGSTDGFELQESWAGYKTLVAELERRFNFAEEWWSKIAFPAFVPNYTILYEQQSSTAVSG